MKQLVCVILLFAASTVSAEIFKCVGPSGETEFRQTACEKSAVNKGKINVTRDGRVNKADEKSNAVKASKTSKASRGSSSGRIPVIAGAKEKTKDVGNGWADYYEYRSDKPFSEVLKYYRNAAGADNCKELQPNNHSCRFSKVSGYKYGEVTVTGYDDRVEITIFKYLQ